MATTLDAAVEEIRKILQDARLHGNRTRPRWPMVILNSPKGWTGPKIVDGLQVEGVVALDPPSDRERRAWYFQRYVAHLPVSGEIALFNRSWYDRAGVEQVMGFSTEADDEEFLITAPLFENLLDHCGVRLIKYYLDVSKAEQKARIAARAVDPLRQWKESKVDKVAVKRWDDYTRLRDAMLARTHTLTAPWTIVKADDKRAARIAVMRDLVSRFEVGGKATDAPDPAVVFPFHEAEALEH